MMQTETASPQPAIRLENVTKSFRDGRDQVLRGVSLSFPPGKLTFILGPSGVGKSVLIKHILGLVAPDSGSVWVDGINLSTLGPKELGKLRMKFGMLFQNSALFDDLSVYENVAFPLREHTDLGEAAISEKVTRTLSLLGMERGLDKIPSELSGGMRKRVGLARAIIREPSILLYDEPTTGLDPLTRNMVEDLIEGLKRTLKLTSVVISHDISSALLLADQIAFLDAGKIVFCGTPQEFKASKSPAIQKFLDAEQRVVNAFQPRAGN